MAIYVDWAYYSTTYLGTAIAQGDFPALALRASAQVDFLTYDRAAGVIAANTDAAMITKIKNATCAVAETLQAIAQSGGMDNIVSERVGNVSVAYGSTAQASLTNAQKVSQAASLYLGMTGLMYRGLNADER